MSEPPAPTGLIAAGQTLLVAGEWRSAEHFYERYDPADLERLSGRFALGTAEDAAAAYDAAAAASPGWAETPAPARAAVLRVAADRLEERIEEAAKRLTADMGKAINDAHAEVARGVAILRYFSGELLQASGELFPSADPNTRLLTVEQPLGIVCAITPWNFPFAIPIWKLAPALGFGNAVVWKPAAAASGSAVLLAEVLIQAGLPPGALNLLTGSGGALSAALTGDDRLAAITFTGSGSVGVGLRKAVADRNVKVQLELGGKNPAVVLADADLEDAAEQIVRGAMLATGQRCTATSRLYVEGTVVADLLELLRDRTERLEVGNPYDPSIDVGPLASAEQRDTIGDYLELAVQERARVVTGGSLGAGCYVQPTILTNVKPDSRLLREEIFGPVLVVQEVDGFESALAAANDTEFGLSAALFTKDLSRAMRFVDRSEAGIVHINRETAGVEPQVPFGGLKASSSMNREQGTAARAFFTTTKTVYVRTP